MKRVILLLLLSVVFTACSFDISETEPTETCGLLLPQQFQTIEEYEQYEKNEENGASCYYIPAAVPEGFALADISKREGIYLSFTYRFDAAQTDETADYETDRLNTLSCSNSLYEDGEAALKSNFIDNGYEPVEYGGRTYYRWDEHALNDPEKEVIGYEIAFLEGDSLIYMHLPAIDTFENMMKYAAVTKIDIQ